MPEKNPKIWKKHKRRLEAMEREISLYKGKNEPDKQTRPHIEEQAFVLFRIAESRPVDLDRTHDPALPRIDEPVDGATQPSIHHAKGSHGFSLDDRRSEVDLPSDQRRKGQTIGG